MPRILCFCTVLLTVAFARPALSQAQNDGWQRVLNLPVGKTIDVYTGTKHQKCKFLSADDQQMSCQRGKRDTFTFSRSEVYEVRLPFTRTFTIVGLLAGTGAGIGIGALVERPSPCTPPNFCESFPSLEQEAGMLVGGVVGGITGVVTGLIVDNSRRETLYLAP
jgi:hypothetical protein